jgi:hypothetical protein
LAGQFRLRRLHDLDRTGWWVRIALTVIGVLLLLFWYAQKGVLARTGSAPTHRLRREGIRFGLVNAKTDRERDIRLRGRHRHASRQSRMKVFKSSSCFESLSCGMSGRKTGAHFCWTRTRLHPHGSPTSLRFIAELRQTRGTSTA